MGKIRTSVENWAFVLVRLARLKRNRLTPQDLPLLEEISTPEEFLGAILKYYPPLSFTPETLTITVFEQSAWKIYFNVVTRLINASPQKWQSLIMEYLLKYQIKNVKTILLGKIADLDPDLIKTHINWEVEDIFDTKKIMELLLTQRTPREILYTLRNSRYGSILREGLTHYFNEKDPLYFQIYLDRYYYTNLLSQNFHLPGPQLDLVRRYINMEAEFQNVRMIYRCLANNFDPRLINELLIPSNFHLKREHYSQLIASRSPDNMKKKFLAMFGKEKPFRFLRESPVLKNFTYYIREFYARLQLQPLVLTESMELRTLDEIFKILKFMEYAIYHLTRTLLRIMHHTTFSEEIID